MSRPPDWRLMGDCTPNGELGDSPDMKHIIACPLTLANPTNQQPADGLLDFRIHTQCLCQNLLTLVVHTVVVVPIPLSCISLLLYYIQPPPCLWLLCTWAHKAWIALIQGQSWASFHSNVSAALLASQLPQNIHVEKQSFLQTWALQSYGFRPLLV